MFFGSKETCKTTSKQNMWLLGDKKKPQQHICNEQVCYIRMEALYICLPFDAGIFCQQISMWNATSMNMEWKKKR